MKKLPCAPCYGRGWNYITGGGGAQRPCQYCNGTGSGELPVKKTSTHNLEVHELRDRYPSPINIDGWRHDPVMLEVSKKLAAAPLEDWEIEYVHTGGGIFCLLAVHSGMVANQYDDWDSGMYIGTANEVWGWDIGGGAEYGDIGMTTDMREGIPISSWSTDSDAIVAAITFTLESWKL